MSESLKDRTSFDSKYRFFTTLYFFLFLTFLFGADIFSKNESDFKSKQEFTEAITKFSLDINRKDPYIVSRYLRTSNNLDQNCIIEGIRNPNDFFELFDIANDKVIDPTGRGLEDIQNKVIRFNHKDVVLNDRLRILRAYRFAKKFGFTIEDRSLTLCRNEFDAMVKEISPTRMLKEIEKLCL